MALPISRIINVQVDLSSKGSATRNFGILMIAGDSDVINAAERYREYSEISSVLADFGADAPEYKGAIEYFSQDPKPALLYIGRWFRTAAPGVNMGGILSTAEQDIDQWTSITDGGFEISVDGVLKNVGNLDFSEVTNLNGVSEIISAAIDGASVTWTGTNFVVTSDTTGAGAKASGTITLTNNPSFGARATNTIELTGNPSDGNTVTINGVTITFVDGIPGANQVEIGNDENETSLNLQAFLEDSVDPSISLFNYETSNLITTATVRIYGTAGNAYTLEKSGANIAIGGANFTGGVAADTLTANGTEITFVASSPTGNQVLVGATKELTAANLRTFLATSTIEGLAEAEYSRSGSIVTVIYKTIGTAGNEYRLAETGSNIAISGESLSGGVSRSSVGYSTAGTGTDISEKLKLNSSSSLGLVTGVDAESPLECVQALSLIATDLYALTFQASIQPTIDQNLEVAAYIEAATPAKIFGVTITDANVTSSLVKTDLATKLKELTYKRSLTQYSSKISSICSLLARPINVNFTNANSTLTVMLSSEPGVTAEDLTVAQANVLQDKNCNVYAKYEDGTAIVQYGVMANGIYIDEVVGADWLTDSIAKAVWNFARDPKSSGNKKIPFTNPGNNLILSQINLVFDQGLRNGFIAPGVWNGADFGILKKGDYMPNGYYSYAVPIELLPSENVQNRRAIFYAAGKLGGAFHGADILVTLVR